MRHHLAIAAAILAARAAMAIPYADTADTPAAAPGELQWRRAADGSPYLTVSSFGGGREAVRDPDALRRVPVTRVPAADLLAELGDGVSAEDGWIVLADAVQPGPAAIVREAWLSAPAGLSIQSLATTNEGVAVSIDYAAGRARVHCEITPPPPGAEPPPVSARFAALYADALPEGREPAPADLARGDYYFTDTVGDISLGTLREWVNAKCAGRLADSWSRYPAASRVWFAGREVVFDALGRFSTAVESGTNTADTLAIVAGGRRAVEIVSEVSQTNAAFRVVDFALSDDTVSMWVTAVGTNVIVQACTNLAASPIVWTDESGVSVDYAPVDRGGVPCYPITFPRVSGPRFWRARTTIGASTEAAVRVNVPLILTSPNGSLWRLKVGNDGTLSTEAW